MTSVIQRLRVTMPNYMCKNVLGYVCESKQQAIYNELVHYIQTQQYLQPDKKELMHSLLDEVISGCSNSSRNRFKKLILCKPKQINLSIDRSQSSGVTIQLDLVTNYDSVISLQICKKRSLIRNVSILGAITPGVVKICEDWTKTRSGDEQKTHNEQIGFFVDLIMGHLSLDMRTFIQHILQNNRWTTMKQSLGLLLSASKGITRTRVKIDFESNDARDQKIRFTHVV